ncbi:MAG: hypothetical protein H0U45_17450 [Tatlockia sp.]|nr:hypothetical protein [Tatlockia sp.]
MTTKQLDREGVLAEAFSLTIDKLRHRQETSQSHQMMPDSESERFQRNKERLKEVALSQIAGELLLSIFPGKFTWIVGKQEIKLIWRIFDVPEKFWENKLFLANRAIELEEEPDNPSSFLGNVLVPDPSLPIDVGYKEAYFLTMFAFKAKEELLKRFSRKSRQELEQLLDLTLKEETEKAGSKLSKLQKEILTKVLNPESIIGLYGIKWGSEEWFGRSTPSDRAAFSRAIKRLESRGLIYRLSDRGRLAPQRTASLSLTLLGYLVVKRLIR